MAIRFPRMHIATSVVNRILNVADDLEAARPRGAPAGFTPDPVLPEVTRESADLDTALSQPPPENVPPIDQTADPGATASGTPLLEAMLKPGSN